MPSPQFPIPPHLVKAMLEAAQRQPTIFGSILPRRPIKRVPFPFKRRPECSYCLGRGKVIGSFLIFWARVKKCPECKGSGDAQPWQCTYPPHTV